MNRRDDVALGLLALIWGSSFLWIKVALEGLSPTQVVAGRMLFGAATLALAARLGYASFPTTLKQWRLVATLSLIQNVLPFALFAWGEERITSSAATMMNATTPLWTAVIAAGTFLPGERLTPRRISALLFGLAGVVVIVAPWHSGIGGQVIGDVACLGAAACYGFGFVFTSRFILGTMPAPAAAVGQIVSGAAISLVIAAVVTGVSDDPPRFDAHILGAVVMLGALSTGVAFLLSFHLQAATGPTATAAVTFLMPFVGVVLGVLVLGERIGWNAALGGVLVLVSAIRVRPKRTLVKTFT